MKIYEKVLFLADAHCPFQDDEMLKATTRFIKYFKPDKIFLLGDIIDFYAISSFVKDPERVLKLQEEIDSTINWLQKIREVSKCEIIYIRGNHEYRLQKYIWTFAPALYNLTAFTLPELLKFDKLNIQYVEQGRMEYKGIIIKHGSIVRKFSGYSAKGEVEKSGKSGVSGHVHRSNVYSETKESGELKWMECGCMCLKDAEYLEGETPNWQNSIGVGYFKYNTNRYHLDLIPYVDGKLMYAGEEY